MVDSTAVTNARVALLSKSATLSPRVFFAPAYASASTARRPELDISGGVWPSLKLPTSGCPRAAQPFPALTRSRSDQPSCFSGQPSACAIGFHMAMTMGESTTGSPAGQTAFVRPGVESHAWLSNVTYAPEAGLKTVGLSAPETMACIASPEPMGRASMRMGRPDLVVPANDLICSSSHFFFSLPYATVTVTGAG